MSLPDNGNEALHALTPGTNAPAASAASNTNVPLLLSTPSSSANVPIDPQLLHIDFFPARKPDGSLVAKEAYKAHLFTIRKREPLRAACSHFGIRFATRANLDFLRNTLVRHWYPARATPNPLPNHAVAGPLKTLSIVIPPRLAHSLGQSSSQTDQELVEADFDVDDDTLTKQYDVGEGVAEAVFGALNTGGLEEEGEDEELEDMDLDDDVSDKFTALQIFQKEALAAGKLRDDIVDEHALLLFIDFCARRCKRDRRGEYILNTRIGASQIKKEFFGALRIRKVQDARDPTLTIKRPATTVHVYDAVKTRMDEALQKAREGLIPAEDAPDIITNTFLAQLSDETLTRIWYGFLEHREFKPTINGHLTWTMMNASGNHRDDIRALRLCEMQPYQFLHPNGETTIPTVLGLQSDMEQKARSKGMKTTINPTYTCFIAHRNPEMCPLGAFALYLHYVHDVANIDSKYNVDYAVNKSWRNLRLIHGSSATVPYHETALQNLFVQSYRKAGVESNLKAHLARHMLGYHQEKMGPPWTQVDVPKLFLELVCPMAEKNVELVKGLKDRVGATNYWEMVVWLCPFLFQASAAIYQVRPNSKLFRLPALARDDVRLWMQSTFPVHLAAINSSAVSPVCLERLQNEIMRKSLEQLRQESVMQKELLHSNTAQIEKLAQIVQRRTSQWTPAKAISYETTCPSSSAVASISRQLEFPSDSTVPILTAANLGAPAVIGPETRAAEDMGVYLASDNSLHGFIVPLPHSTTSPRPRTEVDLVLPPLITFCKPGDDLLLEHPILGQGSVHWNDVFAQVKQPGPLWDTWKPSKTLDQMLIQDIWDCYNVGEGVEENGVQTGVKPPLRLGLVATTFMINL
ncbi:uncharacterized protein LACBIDRAFT_330862 [Laccaria bicolor S238N-H82]|uniref:Predicted protein n=1 Tax=Laccaria bicolor (strain S238N-H82 / ATCC MYA-4686) TaxID=486041 RepID=B0DN00_LACBS|nr:uncharacterized protein LACBIDRAFT_330862 [Laccaria bicolor S238N-H82]EDR04062.1 predicted protein [Laccaria bicolor S238N-H82]|eukprot:XP_001885317.1 predicted protein [Laccaria bicolor S238N-H82]